MSKRKSKETLRWAGSNAAASEHEQAVEEARRRAASRPVKQGKTKSRRSGKRAAFVGTYREYIRSNQWKRIRRLAIKHYGGRCSVCGAKDRLEVHHRHYKTLFRERMEDLSVLCNGCHRNEHEGSKPGVVDPLTAEYLRITIAD